MSKSLSTVKKTKIFIVIVAYNAEKTLKKVYEQIPKVGEYKILVVDDNSADDTVKVAQNLGLKIFKHSWNKGYGAAQKTAYLKALEAGADIVVMLHADNQYPAGVIPKLVEPLIEKKADFVFGSRFLSVSNTMPMHRNIANRALTFFENAMLKSSFSELHSGFRAYNSKVLEQIRFKSFSNGFLFDSQMIIESYIRGFRIKEIPIDAYYDKESSSIKIVDAFLYAFGTIIYLIRRKYGLM